MMFAARFSNNGEAQSLEDHLSGVAHLASARVDTTLLAKIAGLLHDIGKYSQSFQQYLTRPIAKVGEHEEEDIVGRIDHSSAGAQFLMQALQAKAESVGDTEIQRLLRFMGRMVAHCIAGHHAGLLNGFSSNGPSLEKRLAKTLDPYQESIPSSLCDQIRALIDALSSGKSLAYVCKWIDADGNISGREAFSLQFVIRMLFSALVDADRLHSEETGSLDQSKTRQGIRKDSLEILQAKLDAHLKTLKTEGEVNRIRQTVSEHCRQASALKPGFFDLTVPTGGGKTLASLRFAIAHAIAHTMRRIIYVMPFTSIIDQNADEFRKILDAENLTQNVLEHHSNMEPQKETPESRLLAENWEAPIVVTTNVQFFESLYSNHPSRCRRLHSIQRSVIILDEAQTVPVRYLKAVTWALEELVKGYGCSVVFCTATQPVLKSERIDQNQDDDLRVGLRDIKPIIRSPQGLYDELQRVKVECIKTEQPLSAPKVAEYIREKASEGKSVLSIVNTKKNAAAVFKELRKESSLSGRLFHLSTSMCPRHRKNVIEIVKHLTGYCRDIGASSHSPIVISTQLVEAGVNLDFDVVFRALSGVDSIAQAAGRCNREGKLLPRLGEVFVYEAEENLGSLIDIIEAKRAGAGALAAIGNDPKLAEEEKDPIGLKAVEEYFERLYWSRRDEMDREKIVERLAACHQFEHATDIPFADIGRDFHIIKEDTVSVIVPYGEEGKTLIHKLQRGERMSIEMLCVARQHSVQIYRSALAKYKSIITPTPSGWLVVDSSLHYKETGLTPAETLSVEDYIA